MTMYTLKAMACGMVRNTFPCCKKKDFTITLNKVMREQANILKALENQ